ncbi:MAG: two-component sensor histidine kinase, partial [Neisseriaceae bacterium]|nr:two-component sensor histidine kinase [Neisseriaceae bacterium]
MKPLTHALNHLFGRVQETIQREQRFTSDAAHELRSPLAALKVQAEVLAMSDTEEEQTHALVNILDSIDRSERLIGQLLALSRLDSNTGDTLNEVIDWASISEKVLQNSARNAREKHIQLKREVFSGSLKEVLPLTGNPTLIELMLRNLIDNAIRYTPIEGEVVLEMGDDFVRVMDNGKGIDPAYLPRIRERFFRPPGQKESGSGLGLSIIDRIATLHGLTFILQNRETGGLKAEVRIEKTSD